MEIRYNDVVIADGSDLDSLNLSSTIKTIDLKLNILADLTMIFYIEDSLDPGNYIQKTVEYLKINSNNKISDLKEILAND